MATWALYNAFKTAVLGGTHDLDSDTLKIKLCTSAVLPAATDANSSGYTEVSNSGTNYTTGGATVPAALSGTSTVKFDADDVSWTTATFTARFAVLYNTSKSNAVIAYLDFGSDQSVTNGTFASTMDASNGIFTLA